MKRLIVLICNFHIPEKRKKKKAWLPHISHARNFLSAWEKGGGDGEVPKGSCIACSPLRSPKDPTARAIPAASRQHSQPQPCPFPLQELSLPSWGGLSITPDPRLPPLTRPVADVLCGGCVGPCHGHHFQQVFLSRSQARKGEFADAFPNRRVGCQNTRSRVIQEEPVPILSVGFSSPGHAQPVGVPLVRHVHVLGCQGIWRERMSIMYQ